MTMKVKTNHVPLGCDYLTEGKEYKLLNFDIEKETGSIINDKGMDTFIYIPRSSHLNGNSWEIIGEEDE